jgi:hypothetical protein
MLTITPSDLDERLRSDQQLYYNFEYCILFFQNPQRVWWRGPVGVALAQFFFGPIFFGPIFFGPIFFRPNFSKSILLILLDFLLSILFLPTHPLEFFGFV